MNNINLIGYLGKNPTFYAGKGKKKAFLVVNLAVDNGKDLDPTWVRVKCWGKAAEAAQHLAKGSRIAVSGSLQNNDYKDKDGKEVYSFAVHVPFITFLDKKVHEEQEEEGYEEEK